MRETSSPRSDDPRAGAAEPDKVGSRDARHALHRDAQGARQSLGRRVDQRVDGPPSQAKAGDADEDGDADRGERVGVRPARARRRQADEDEDRGKEIAGKMQRVGGERVAGRFPRDARQGAPAHEIDADRHEDRAEGEGIGVDDARLADAAQRLEGDGDGQDDEKPGLRQRRDRLDLGVAERMVLVGRLVGDAHGIVGQRAGADVEAVVRGLGEKRQRTGHRPRRELGERQGEARRDGGERGAPFERRRSVVLAGLGHRGHG